MTKKRGFTVLEVVLVLAIAGLIFLMVFIALPQMQRMQRDSRRKDDMMLFVGDLQKYTSAYRGTLPKLDSNKTEDDFGQMDKEAIQNSGAKIRDDSWPGFWVKYVEDDFGDPSAGYYNLSVRTCDTNQGEECAGLDEVESPTIFVFMGGVCKEDRAVTSINERDYAVVYQTESSGMYCFDSGS